MFINRISYYLVYDLLFLSLLFIESVIEVFGDCLVAALAPLDLLLLLLFLLDVLPLGAVRPLLDWVGRGDRLGGRNLGEQVEGEDLLVDHVLRHVHKQLLEVVVLRV